MTPYIITTSEPFDAAKHSHRPAFTCHAVATLEKAQSVVNDYLAAKYSMLAPSLDEGGSTIGPLPDGTVIEVKSALILDLAAAAGYQIFSYAWQRPEFDQPSDQQIIDAFNAAQTR